MDLSTLVRGWRWLLASPLEIFVLGAPPEDKPTFVVSVGRALTIYARFRLRFVNHRTDRAERIIGASIVLRHRRRDGRMTVIAELPLLTIGSSRPLEFRLEPLAGPVEFDVKADGSAEVTVLPIRSQLVLVMKMVGPIRRHEHTLSTVTNRLPAPEPSTGPSALVRLLKDAFPSLEEGGPAVVNCKVARMIQLDRDGLAPLSAAVDALTRAGQRAVFIKRIQQEHPTRRVHQEQYDLQVFNCFTEACALAWSDLRDLGKASFAFSTERAPDVYVDPDLWVEAKAILPSDEDRHLTAWMVRTGGVVSGSPALPAEGFWRKLDCAYENAKKKFDGLGHGRFVVFFNLMLDLESVVKRAEVFDLAKDWADRKESDDPSIQIVLTYNYDWQSPLRDPFIESK